MQFSKLATRRLRVPANRCRRALCARLTHVGCAGLDVARRRSRAPPVFFRPCTPVRRWTAPRRGSRRADGRRGARAGAGRGLIRRDGPERGQDRLDRDAFWLHGDARPPWLDRREARRAGQRRCGRRHGRAERRGRLGRSVRVLRGPPHVGRAGLRRPARSATAATGRRGAERRGAARERRGTRKCCRTRGRGCLARDGARRRRCGLPGCPGDARGSGTAGRSDRHGCGCGRSCGRSGRARRRPDSIGRREPRRPQPASRPAADPATASSRQRLTPASVGTGRRGRREAPGSRFRVERAANGPVAGRFCAAARRRRCLPPAPRKAGRRPTYHG